MSHHKQSHQHQPQNPLHVVHSPQPTPAAAPGVRANGARPSPDHVRVRAYEISQARNGGPGDASSDWSQAEKELTTASATKA